MYVFGENGLGQLNSGDKINKYIPFGVFYLFRIKKLSCGVD